MYYCNACGYELKIQVGICPVCGSLTGYEDAPELQAKYREGYMGNEGQPSKQGARRIDPPGGMDGNVQGGQGMIPQGQIPTSERPTSVIGGQGRDQGSLPMGVPTGYGPARGGVSGEHGFPQGGMPAGQGAPQSSMPGGMGYPQGGMPTGMPTGQNPSGRVPTGERPTAKVTVGDTGNLTSPVTKPGSKPIEPKRSREEKKNYRVKKRPKHLALKLSLLGVLLVGIAVGAFFVIRAMQQKKETQASFKPFRNADVVSEGGECYVGKQLIVHGTKDATKKKISKLAEEKNGSVVGMIPICNDYQVEFANALKKTELDQIRDEWSKNDLVASVDLHYVYGTQGGFFYTDNVWKDDNNEGEPYGKDLEWNIYQPGGNNWAVESVWAPKIWEAIEEKQKSGTADEYSNVGVGIIDSTFDPTHKDLSDKFAPFKAAEGEDSEDQSGMASPLIEGNPNTSGDSTVKDAYAPYVGKYGSKDLSDVDAIEEKRLSHGTHIAGIIGANLQDNFGIAGVAQNSTLYAYASTGDGAYQGGNALTSIFEYKYALSRMKESGVRLINVSMDLDPVITDADSTEGTKTQVAMVASMNNEIAEFLQASMEEENGSWDFLIIKSAGDEASSDISKNFLSGIENEAVKNRIVVVGGAECDYDGSKLAGYKKTETTNFGGRIDIYGPGPNVLSDIPGDRTEMRSGTSEATAFVTGGCALVSGILPSSSMVEVKQTVLENCYYTVKTKVDDATIERGYLNLYMAVEAARAKRDSGDLAGIRDKMQKEMDENQPKGGTLDLSLDQSFMEEINDISKVKGTAKNGDDEKQFVFDNDGKVKLELEEGTWHIRIEAEGYEVIESDETITSGNTTEKKGIVLSAQLVDLQLSDLPQREQLINLLNETMVYPGFKDNTDRYGLGWQILAPNRGWAVTARKYLPSDPPGYELIEDTNGEASDRVNPKHINGTGDSCWMGYKKEGVEWIEKNVLNLSQETIDNLIHDQIDEPSGGYYEYEGYYYTWETYEGFAGSGKLDLVSAKRQGNRYYIIGDKYSMGRMDGYDDEGYPTDWMDNNRVTPNRYEYEVELKTVDGMTFWSIYDCREPGQAPSQEPEESSTEASSGIVLQLSDTLMKKFPDYDKYPFVVTSKSTREHTGYDETKVPLGGTFDKNGKMNVDLSVGQYRIAWDGVDMNTTFGEEFWILVTDEDVNSHSTIQLACAAVRPSTNGSYIFLSDGRIGLWPGWTNDFADIGRFTDIKCLTDSEASGIVNKEKQDNVIPQYAADHHVYSMELSELKEDPDVEHPIHLREGKKYYIYLTRFDSDTSPGYIAVRRYVLDENYGFVEGNGDLIEK